MSNTTVIQPYDRTQGMPTITVGFYVHNTQNNVISYEPYYVMREYTWRWLEPHKTFVVSDEVARNSRHYDTSINSDGALVLTLKPNQAEEIEATLFGSFFNNRHIWRNQCAQWKAINPTTPPSEYFEALHNCCFGEGQEATIKGLSTLQSRQVNEDVNSHKPNIERLAKLIANHLHPYDETNNTYGIHEHLTEINDATHYFSEIRTGLLADNKEGYHLGLSDDEFLKNYVESKLPKIKIALASTTNQTGTAITATVTKERLTGGTFGWQKLVSDEWTDIAGETGATYTPTEVASYRVKYSGTQTSNGNPAPTFYSDALDVMAPPASLSFTIGSINDRINTPLTTTINAVSVADGYTINWEIERRAGRFMEWVSAGRNGATGTSFTPTIEGNYRAKITGAVGTDGTNLPVVYSNERYIT